MDHNKSHVNIESETLPRYFLHISQTLDVSTFADTADIFVTIHFVLRACQHIIVNYSHSRSDMVAKIL